MKPNYEVNICGKNWGRVFPFVPTISCISSSVDRNRGMPMDGWSVPRNGSVMDCGEAGGNCETDGVCLDIGNADSVECTGKLQALFDQVLLIFMKEVLGKQCVRPIPAMLGDGRSVDLFKLFCFVKEKGGYEWVSDKGLWGLVAEECGLDAGVKTCLKLIYFKYLIQLDRWLLGILRNGASNNEGERGGKMDSLLEELGIEFRGLILDGICPRAEYDGVSELECGKTDSCSDSDNDKSHKNLSTELCRAEKNPNDEDKKNCVDGGIQDPILTKKSNSFRKRKRESYSRMLKWVREIAKHPEGGCKGNKYGSEVFSNQLLRVRESLLIRGKVWTKGEECHLQKQKMHPSMYEDNIVVNHQSIERSRCSRRLSSPKSDFCSYSAAQGNPQGPQRTDLENCPKEQLVNPNEQEPGNTNNLDDLCSDDLFRETVPVGPNVQAEVPEWTGEVTESDSKWLGTKVWPLENGECNAQIEDCVGRGKPNYCCCRFPGSVECVRFHIAEKRMKLKIDLGTLFYHWRFDRMGEEISLAWTMEEENRFKQMIKSNSSLLTKSFCNNASRIFPTKKREDLLNYYFNVFLIRRRIYQNRVTPRMVDSDDDKSEFGSLGGNFGDEVIKVPWSKFLICTQNEQSTELD